MTLHIIYYIIFYLIEKMIVYSRCDIIVKTLLGTPQIHDICGYIAGFSMIS
jgi:hypothetical protein